jgi:hypothetical protein
MYRPSAFDSDDSGLKEPEAEKEDVVIVTCEDAEGNEILSSELLKEMDKKLTVEPKQDDGICMMPLYNPSFFVNRNRHGGCVSEEEDEESDDE